FEWLNSEPFQREKAAGSYMVREGGAAVRASELEGFGIEPFEMKVMDARPIVLKPGEGPPVTNGSGLQIEKIEKHFNTYQVWLKNKSAKGIVTYKMSYGNGSTTESVLRSYASRAVVLPPGGTSDEVIPIDDEVERTGIKFPLIVYDDGTFEGDPKL